MANLLKIFEYTQEIDEEFAAYEAALDALKEEREDFQNKLRELVRDVILTQHTKAHIPEEATLRILMDNEQLVSLAGYVVDLNTERVYEPVR